MKLLAEFVSEHLSDDTSKLILSREKWPDIDMDLAVNCIESRRKLKGKVQEWYDNSQLIFPVRLSAEQCSSSQTAGYKASLAEQIAGKGFRLADITGGLGIDSWFFSLKAEEVLYNEMQPVLCEAARHNFAALGAGNIKVCNHLICSASDEKSGLTIETSPEMLLKEFNPDIIYIDPARRGEGGRKVFLIEECTPDVLKLKDEMFGICRHILIKLSPMADISMVCSRLGTCCREVHVVAAGRECKEMLVWLDKEWNGEYRITSTEILPDGNTSSFVFLPSEEKGSAITRCSSIPDTGALLFEPGKALMKAGAFNLICDRFCMEKLSTSTHYYILSDNGKHAEEMMQYGKVFRILRKSSLDKRNIKTAGHEFPKAEVTARNISMDTETLRKKLGVISDDRFHIFGLKSDMEGNLLLCTEKI